MIRKFASKNAPPAAAKPKQIVSSGMSQPSTFTEAYMTSRYSLEIDGVPILYPHSIDGIESVTDVIPYRDGEEGVTHFRAGMVTTNVLRISKNMSTPSELFQWRKAVLDGKVERRSISVIFHNDAGEETARYTFSECWPVRYSLDAFNARSSGHASERIEISWETMELKAQ
jgi:phage tail-like protein